MADRVLSSGEAYMFKLLEMWEDVIVSSEKYRLNLIQERLDPITLTEHFVKLTRIWFELVPIMEGRTEFGEELVTEFLSYEKYYINPGLFLKDEYIDDADKLEKCLRMIIHKSKVTWFSNEAKSK